MIFLRRVITPRSAPALAGLFTLTGFGFTWSGQAEAQLKGPSTSVRRRVRVLGTLRGRTIRTLPGGRRVAARTPAKKPVKEDPSHRLVVKERVPRGAAPHPPTPPVRRFRRRYRYRRTQPVYIKASPTGKNLVRVRLGVKVKILGSKGDYYKVKTLGLAEVNGFILKETVGHRVLRKTKLLASPSAKGAVGDVQAGMLVHVKSKRGAYSKVVLMGQSPIELWIKSKDLGTASGKTSVWRHRYPGGRYMNLKKGPIHAKANGRVIARAVDHARVYRVVTKGKWTKVAVAAYRHVNFIGWVPASRVQYGYHGAYYGSGYRLSTYEYSSGNMVAVVKLPVYLALDDAYPTAYIKAGAKFNVGHIDDQWVSVRFSGYMYFSGYMPKRIGLWVPVSTYSRRRR